MLEPGRNDAAIVDCYLGPRDLLALPAKAELAAYLETLEPLVTTESGRTGSVGLADCWTCTRIRPTA